VRQLATDASAVKRIVTMMYVHDVPLQQELMQVYDAQIPERTCLALLDNESPVEPAHSLSEGLELSDSLPGGLSSYMMSDKLHHKDLWPPNAWDLLGWLIGALTLFIAAGVQLL
jgi:hypothetical protein